MARAWQSKRRWGIILLAALVGWAAYWPIPRLELSGPKGERPLYLSLPSNHLFQILYGDKGEVRTEIRRFSIERNGKIRFLETEYLHPSPHLANLFDPKDVSRRGDTLIVRAHGEPVPALHLVVAPGKRRVLWLGKDQRIDLAKSFPPGTVVTLQVARKALLFFLWNRYVSR